jgi:hypothetical protein
VDNIATLQVLSEDRTTTISRLLFRASTGVGVTGLVYYAGLRGLVINRYIVFYREKIGNIVYTGIEISKAVVTCQG